MEDAKIAFGLSVLITLTMVFVLFFFGDDSPKREPVILTKIITENENPYMEDYRKDISEKGDLLFIDIKTIEEISYRAATDPFLFNNEKYLRYINEKRENISSRFTEIRKLEVRKISDPVVVRAHEHLLDAVKEYEYVVSTIAGFIEEMDTQGLIECRERILIARREIMKFSELTQLNT